MIVDKIHGKNCLSKKNGYKNKYVLLHKTE